MISYLTERHAYVVAQSNGDNGEYEADKAYIKLTTLKKAAIIALRGIYKVASHTFHVYLWDLMQGARANDSHVFTRVKESRNQHLVQARLADAAGLRLKPHSARDNLFFLEKHFVDSILRHTRNPGIGIYEWCNSFSPLTRTFFRISQNDDLNTVEQHRVNKCITARVTDFEKAILAQANDKWKPNELKKDLSSADSNN
jgi:hypothetical protein